MNNTNKEPSDGCYQNLLNQVHAITKNCHEGSIKTRYRYEEATERFCKFLAQEFKTQRFANVRTSHVQAYVSYMQQCGKSPSTIKTDLSGIRFYHRHSGSKNIIADNSHFNLEKRQFGRTDRSWLTHEIEAAKIYAKEYGRLDVYHSINLGSNFGFRLEEVVKIEPIHIRNALVDGEIYTKGKNGQVRYIKIRTEEQVKVLKEALQYADSLKLKPHDKILCDNVKGGVQRQKRSIQSFLHNHNDVFRDPERRNIIDTQKLKVMELTYHGLRGFYANALYNDILKETGDKHFAKRYTSEMLAHHRPEITDIYLK